MFEAALDAAEQKPWAKENAEGDLSFRFLTQLRRLDRSALLLGIKPNLTLKVREETAEILGVSGQLLSENTSLLETHSDYRTYGQAISNVLKPLSQNTRLFERLAESGAGIRLWSPPHLWNPQRKRLGRSSFQSVRTRASP